LAAPKRRPRVDWTGKKIVRLRSGPRYEQLHEVARKAQNWSIEKLSILDYYLGYDPEHGPGGGFLKAAQRAPQRFYVDGYSGPGHVRAGKGGPLLEGSPLIALEAAVGAGRDARGTSDDGRIRFTKCLFVESHARAERALRLALANYESTRWRLWRGDFNALAPDVFGQVNPLAPVFAFLDLEDLDDLDFATIRSIANLPNRRRKVELLITLPVGRLLPRAAHLPSLQSMLARTTGAADDVAALFAPYQEPAAIEWDKVSPALVELFTRQLEAAGYLYVQVCGLPRTNPIFHLVFATDHPVGAEIMKDAFDPETRRRREVQIRLI